MWLDAGISIDSPEDYLEGSPFDRAVFTILIGGGLIVLARRKVVWSQIARNNWWLLLLILYAGMSVIWSDFPFVTMKRWFKSALGTLIMALIILTEEEPLEAVKAMIRRYAYLCVPFSILLFKYYPGLGRVYTRAGDLMVTGVTTHKNSLGLMCALVALTVLQDLAKRDSDRVVPSRMTEYLAWVLIVMMALWLLMLSNSATAFVCSVVGFLVYWLTGLSRFRNNPRLIWWAIVIGALAVFGAGNLLDLGSLVTSSVGREQTLTGRTELWQELLQIQTAPWLGVGYDSFWLGDRAASFWNRYYWNPNQAHNGYLEMYLNLGWIGACILGVVIVLGFNKIISLANYNYEWFRFRMQVFMFVICHNFTEAGFGKMAITWLLFFLVVIDLGRNGK